MKHTVAALIAAIVVLHPCGPFGRASAQTGTSFPEAPMPAEERRSYALAYLSLTAGVGLIASSFVFQKKANSAYEEYLMASDPPLIEQLYDETVHYDRLSSGALLTGEVMLALGIYLRFLRPAPENRLSLDIGPRRCAVALRF